ncbi:unnamed protein product [Adineta ricciae]|uniref:G-protein coupled receptors family 1 profile domain-containing protein n=1 Tax=Adineta ricciae TaxID=249248 RepID=A0A815Z585_ADIRI|nr:unnamed protein product [Adineta ricciae]CAF1579081.1 unnamed protein product [Adineta ricciae]
MSLTILGNEIVVYTGSVFLAIGIFGNIGNIYIFSRLSTYRRTPSIFHYLIASMCNLHVMLFQLIPLVITSNYNFDLSRTSIVWCKMRTYFTTSITPISFTCVCLATIDQFFATSQNDRIRRFSHIKIAYRCVVITTLFWLIHGISGAVFYSNISGRCSSTDAIFNTYATIYVSVIVCLLPITVQSIFGWLVYRNLRQTIILAREQADRQATRMILMGVLLVLISISPYGANSIYLLTTANIQKDVNQLTKDYFAIIIVNLITYMYFIGSFYIFAFASPRFRQSIRRQIFWWFRSNNIRPT